MKGWGMAVVASPGVAIVREIRWALVGETGAGRPKTNGGHTGHRPKSVPPTELTDGRRTVESEVNGDRKSLLLELTFKLGAGGAGGGEGSGQ